MGKTELTKRYFIFFLGLISVSLGVALLIKAALGTSPISSIPYSISLILPVMSLGKWTILFNLGLVASQLFLLGKNAPKAELLLQSFFCFFFGSFIDLALFFLQSFQPQLYVFKILTLLAGCVILAFGAYLQVVADVVMLPGDAFVRTIAEITGKEFGTVRMISDICMTSIAAVLCLVFLHALIGVREGTIIAALITGRIINIFKKTLRWEF